MKTDKLLKLIFAATLVVLAILLSKCADDIDNYYVEFHTHNECTDSIPPPPRNYCYVVYFDIILGDSGRISLNAYPDSMQYLMTWKWVLKGRLFNQQILLTDWDAETVLPYRNELWEVRLETQFPGNDYPNGTGCAFLGVRAVNPFTGYISNRMIREN